jgi:hypothetical protein
MYEYFSGSEKLGELMRGKLLVSKLLVARSNYWPLQWLIVGSKLLRRLAAISGLSLVPSLLRAA